MCSNMNDLAGRMAKSTGINVPGVTTGVPDGVKSVAAAPAAVAAQPGAAAQPSGATTSTTPIVVPKKKALSDGEQSTGFLTDVGSTSKTAMGQ